MYCLVINQLGNYTKSKLNYVFFKKVHGVSLLPCAPHFKKHKDKNRWRLGSHRETEKTLWGKKETRETMNERFNKQEE